jgi:hypothetical protein
VLSATAANQGLSKAPEEAIPKISAEEEEVVR